MKTPLFLLSTLLLAPAARAQTTVTTAPITAPITAPKPGAWLSGRGALSADEVSVLVGARFAPAERARLEGLVAARNAGLERLNADFLAGLGQVLGQEEAQIRARVEQQAALNSQSRDWEQMKRNQPSRYRELMRRKRAAEKKNTP